MAANYVRREVVRSYFQRTLERFRSRDVTQIVSGKQVGRLESKSKVEITRPDLQHIGKSCPSAKMEHRRTAIGD